MKSAYIHIPFCSSICSYCDFCKFFYNEDIANKYIDSLINEIKTGAIVANSVIIVRKKLTMSNLKIERLE